MSVEDARSMRTLARFYRQFGFNVIPLGANKKPVLIVGSKGEPYEYPWRKWTEYEQTDTAFDEMAAPKWWKDVRGIGGIAGTVSRGAVCVDFDNQQPFEVVQEFLGHVGLDGKYAWLVRSPNGWHVWFRCPDLDLPKSKGKVNRTGIRGGHTELRWKGHQTALPGSLHPTGKRYEWHNDAPDVPPHSVAPEALVAAYMAVTLEDAEEEEQKTRTAGKPARNGAIANGGTPYGLKALNDAIAAIGGAAIHTRNDTLNAQAFSMGQLVGGGELEETPTIQALIDAALHCGLDEGEAEYHAKRAVEEGKAEPRSAPEREDRNPSYTPDIDVTGDDAQAFLDEGGEPAEFNPWPYGVYDGRLVYCFFDKNEDLVRSPVGDFYASIAEELIDESGDKTFVIAGRALRGGDFRFEIPARAMGEDRTLRGLLEEATGALDGIYNRMSGHLAKGIKSLTRKEELTVTRRFRRTGWHNGQFLLPGMADGVRIELPPKLPYGAEQSADLDTGLQVLKNTIEAIDPSIAAPIFAMMFEAPIHRRASWRAKRYGIFIQGRTGSLKTSWTQVAMCMYGAGFMDDVNLLKWGEGATRNAIMKYATAAHDLPFLIDNYKPNTGDGAHGFINLIHNIIEGSERDRSRRDGSLMPSAPIHAYPLCTGEDVPDHDSSSLSRLFVVQFPWQSGKRNAQLTAAQKNARHFNAVGRAWVEWIASTEGQAAIDRVGGEFDACAERWADYLVSIRADAANANRVAENLASNELAWSIACQHPQIGPILRPYTQQHIDGLSTVAEFMARRTADALEAQQFLSSLRELLVSRQYILIQRAVGEPTDFDANRTLGWYDETGIYLLPTIAMSAIRRLSGPNSIPITAQALYAQLDKLGQLASKDDGGRNTKVIRVGGKTTRVIHLKTTALDSGEDEDNGPSILETLGL